MSAASSSFRFSLTLSCLVVAIIAAAVTMSSCGSNSHSVPVQKLSGNTSVTVSLSSTANDQLVDFALGLTGITLTSKSGKTVSLYSVPAGTQQWAEFIHVNGTAEPLVTLSVPQDVYTSAAVTTGDSYFTCVTRQSTGNLDISFYAYGTNPSNAPPSTITVNLASPITITGDSMGLTLDLQVAQSASYSACYDPGLTGTYSITPTFNLTPVSLSANPTNAQNGKIQSLMGEVTAIGGSSFTLTMPNGSRTLSVSSNGSTEYQGIPDFSAIILGTFVDLDAALQADGSLVASRIAVADPAAIDVVRGSALQVGQAEPAIPEQNTMIFNLAAQGRDQIPVAWNYGIGSSQLQIAGTMNNLQSLPFVASFSQSNLVAGQNIFITSQTATYSAGIDPEATTVTLLPQMVNGTVISSTPGGSFTDYTISLASDDLFPTLAVQPGQITLLNSPSVMDVYVDSNTQKLNTSALAPGSTLRFYGLVFNDNGALRMDCAQVSDGVTASSLTTTQNALRKGEIQTVRQFAVGNSTRREITRVRQ